METPPHPPENLNVRRGRGEGEKNERKKRRREGERSKTFPIERLLKTVGM